VRIWWDTLSGFFRRCAWSPDAELTGEKAQQQEGEKGDKENADPVATKPMRQESVAIFTRGTLQQPLFLLPTPEPSVTIRWCPCLFELDNESTSTITDLPYRMMLAVATSEDDIGSVLLFETQHVKEIYHVDGVHYGNMTNLAWAPSGRHFVSSRHVTVMSRDWTLNHGCDATGLYRTLSKRATFVIEATILPVRCGEIISLMEADNQMLATMATTCRDMSPSCSKLLSICSWTT
jgi:hypothetical protein